MAVSYNRTPSAIHSAAVNIALLTAIVSSSATLLGAIVGGLATYFSAAAAHKRAAKKERDDERLRRERGLPGNVKCCAFGWLTRWRRFVTRARASAM